MDNALEWLNLIFRWMHVVAGVMWIGHLWFFNFVNSQLAAKYTPDSKKVVLPELMPRALYWFRWGAAYTWFSGLILLGIVYYMGGVLMSDNTGMSVAAGSGIGVGAIVVVFFIYDAIWKSPLAKNQQVAAAISFVLIAAAAFGFSRFYSGRSVWIHIGALFGTIMAMNVWMRIWPAQRKIIAGVKGTAPAPDAAVPAMAGLRSKHNTYMSVPLILTMVSNHFPTIYGSEFGWAILAGCILIGWGVTWLLYKKSASAAPASF